MTDFVDLDDFANPTRGPGGQRLKGWRLHRSMSEDALRRRVIELPDMPGGRGRGSGKKAKDGRKAGKGGRPPCKGCGTKTDPCRHLKKGDQEGDGKFRGGSYSQLTGVGDDGMEVDHIPPKSVSPLSEATSPSLQMDKLDHRRARSTGSSKKAKRWREEQQRLINAGRYRDAVALDYHDRRRLAREAGDPRKYNEGLLERSEYQKCLEQHGLLPGKKGK